MVEHAYGITMNMIVSNMRLTFGSVYVYLDDHRTLSAE